MEIQDREIKKLNLVYTSWNENGFVPNGYDIFPNSHFFDSEGFFNSYINHIDDVNEKRKFEIVLEKINNINNKDIYFYAISHPNLTYDVLSDNLNKISKNIIDNVRTKKLYIVLLYEHESPNIEEFYLILKEFKKLNIPLNKIILVNNNSKLYEYKDRFNTDIVCLKTSFIDYSSTEVLTNLDFEFSADKKGKFFMCRNRNIRNHRQSLILHFYLNNLLNDINYSFVPQFSYARDDIHPYLNYFDRIDVEENLKLINHLNTHIKFDEYEENEGVIDKNTLDFVLKDGVNPIFRVPEVTESFKNSYFNIVTESQYESKNNNVHITEKTFRPFFYYQFPIFLASYQHIKFLKQEYDFDLFDDVINHSYDNELNDKIRMNMVVDEIKRINSNQNFFKRFYVENKDRFIRNRKILMEGVSSKKKKDFNFFWNLCD